MKFLARIEIDYDTNTYYIPVPEELLEEMELELGEQVELQLEDHVLTVIAK